MNHIQTTFISLLSASIRNQTLEPSHLSWEDWELLYHEAKAHEAHPLLYGQFKKNIGHSNPAHPLTLLWQREALLSSMEQVHNYGKYTEIAQCLNQNQIPFIPLKGLVLRFFYPQPERRTMCDFDIFIHAEDLTKTIQALKPLGYKICEKDCSEKHTTLDHPNFLSVEVHYHLITPTLKLLCQQFETEIWSNVSHTDTDSSTTLYEMNPKEHLMYLLIHMAGHFTSKGFGLRQICDFVLMVENHPEVSLNALYHDAQAFSLESFTRAIFNTCAKLFQLKIPATLIYSSPSDIDFHKQFIHDLFVSGVHGKRTPERENAFRFLLYTKRSLNRSSKNDVLNYFSYLMPHPKHMNVRYNYAKKHLILAPIAWIHRLIYILSTRDSKKISETAFPFTTKTLSFVETRLPILEWVGLHPTDIEVNDHA